MSLVNITPHISYIPGAVNIGVIENGKDAAIIDSGLDKDSGRLIRKALESEGLLLKAIINTHSHADHFGGNDYLVRNLGPKVYAPKLESGIIQNPLLEPIYLFHGAYPISELRNKFVYAKPSPVHGILDPGLYQIVGKQIEIISLKGHSFNQIGVLVDDIMFCADTVFSDNVIDKYRIPVLQDVANQLKTLDKLSNTTHRLYIPSHTKPTDDITDLVEKNKKNINQLIIDILSLLNEPLTTDQIEWELCSKYGLNLKVVQQYYLIHTTIMSYLSYLHENQKVVIKLDNNKLLWEARK